VRTVIFSRNFGKEAALLAGMERARGDFVATLDCDLQDPPSLLPSMLATVQSGEFDCVGTRRVTRAGEPAVRSFFARAFYRGMRYFAEVEIVDGARDFRLMNRQYVTAILSLRERRRFSKGLFPWVGFRVKWVEYENITRVAGETKWSFWRLFLYAFDGITAFSTKPLAVAVFLGGFMCLLSVCGIFTVVIRKFIYDDSAYGWASAMCIFLFVSGVQLFATGMVGEYLAKVYAEVKQRPHYLVREEK
jgi:glycosyltransferase involved in cell wall biosynthesis